MVNTRPLNSYLKSGGSWVAKTTMRYTSYSSNMRWKTTNTSVENYSNYHLPLLLTHQLTPSLPTSLQTNIHNTLLTNTNNIIPSSALGNTQSPDLTHHL